MNKELQVHNDQVKGKENMPTPDFMSEEYENRFGRQIALTKRQEERLLARLKKEIENWKTDTATLHAELEANNDMLEGVKEDTDFPWTGASNIHIPITAIYMKVVHSVLSRSVLGAEEVYYGETDNEALQDFVPVVENAINYKIKNDWNIARAMKSVLWTTGRDGLGILQIPYAEDWETVNDVVYISDENEFDAEFPSAEESGLSEIEYLELKMRVMAEASVENPIEIPITSEVLKYRGPVGEVVDLVDFCIFPATAQDISRAKCRGYGKRFFLRKGEVRRKKSQGLWIADSVDKLLKKSKSGHSATQYMTSRDRIDGLSRSGKSDEYEFFELVYYFALEPGDEETKLLITYCFEEEMIMANIEYPYRVDFYALFRIEERPNRLIGVSIPGCLRDLNEEIDTQHNQRIHIREITTIPSFKGKRSAKKDFDSDTDENMFYPGVVFWLDDPEAFEQFKVQPTDLGESMNEESNTMRICSLVIGMDAFLASGNPQAADPGAPGNKTIALISQSDLRMEDPINEIRYGVDKSGEICQSHMYQFGPPIIETPVLKYGKIAGKSEFPKRILRRGINLKMNAVTVTQNADAELQKWLSLAATMVKSEPMIAKSAQRRIEWWRTALKAGRVKNSDKLMPTYEEIMQQEIELRKQAILQLQQEQMAKAKQAEQMKQEATVKVIKDTLAKHRLAQQVRKMKEESMAGAGANQNGA